MITFRRERLDALLEAQKAEMAGRVLDVGGRKNKKRGRFRPPLGGITEWSYVNMDPLADPDFLASAESLPVPSASYDLVLFTEVLEYVASPEAALRELARVLKPGGRALISVPFLSPVHGDWKDDRRRFTSRGIEELLLQAGFASAEIVPMGGIGAVLFDLAEAATGYANPEPEAFRVKVSRKLLFWSVPFFRLLDWAGGASISFVTTGYFAVAFR